LQFDPQFSVTSEWKIRNVIAEFYLSDPKDSRSLQSYPMIAIRIKASRVWASYLNEFVITFCMFGLGLGTFALGVDPGDLGSRLAYCVVFLLADVSTLQLLASKLPEIQYMTLLDAYTFSCFLFLFSVTIWSCLAGAVDVFAPYDYVAFWIFFSTFWLYQGIFYFMAWRSRQWERIKLVKTGEELQKQNQRNVCCCGLCCPRGGPSAISLTWHREEFVGEVRDLFTGVDAYEKKKPQIVAYGSSTESVIESYGLSTDNLLWNEKKKYQT